MSAFFQRAIAMRRELAPLRRGDFRVLRAETGSGLLAFARRFQGERVTVAFNCSPEPAELPACPGGVYWAEGLENHTLEGFGFAVLVDGRA